MLRRLLATIALLASSACSGSADDSSEPALTPLLAPPAEGAGIQLSMKTRIEPGAEVEHCKFVQLDGDDLWVNRDEVRFTEGSHHFLLFDTTYDEIPTMNAGGESVDTSGVFDCSEGPFRDWSVTGFLAGSQNASGDSAVLFPDGVAMMLPGRRVVLMNAHYLNATPEALEPEVFLNLHTIPESTVETEGGILFWYNPFIRVPANGEAHARAACNVQADVNIVALQSHMHRRGVGFVAEAQRESGREVLYENENWENVFARKYDPELVITKGTRVQYECTYSNPEARDVYQGFTTKDEMCVLVGTYYPVAPAVRSCFGEFWWQGEGTASCADSLACMQGAVASENRFAAMSDCVLDSSPSVADALSTAMSCMIASSMGEGGMGGNPLEACATEFATCSMQ